MSQALQLRGLQELVHRNRAIELLKKEIEAMEGEKGTLA